MSETYGSSPRVRGTPRAWPPNCDLIRFIPACAGNAGRGGWGPDQAAVHPRVCGERGGRPMRYDHICGSSPRVRGTRRSSRQAAAPGRFIPACAGNAEERWLEGIAKSVHPRVCGERRPPLSGQGVRVGSSPRVRGTPGRGSAAIAPPRFIPACAGNAAPSGPGTGRAPVHPRVCGERSWAARSIMPSPGSSPRVRGTPSPSPAACPSGRFIPACAGNALAPGGRHPHGTVHPRVCGERTGGGGGWGVASGSSPRVRGTLHNLWCQPRYVRFIPACAGNAWGPSPGSYIAPVHPRVCGERVGGLADLLLSIGSSPRVRGTRSTRRAAAWPGWFIPACAGNATGQGSDGPS